MVFIFSHVFELLSSFLSFQLERTPLVFLVRQLCWQWFRQSLPGNVCILLSFGEDVFLGTLLLTDNSFSFSTLSMSSYCLWPLFLVRSQLLSYSGSLYMMSLFSLYVFKTFSVFLVKTILTKMCLGGDLSCVFIQLRVCWTSWIYKFFQKSDLGMF